MNRAYKDTSIPVVRLNSLVYEIDSHKILDGLNLEVNSEEILAVMGKSGSGKTTILRFIMGLIKPTSGEIWVGEKEITVLKEQDLLQIRKQMGLVFQNAALFDSLTVGENVAFGLSEQGGYTKQELVELASKNLALVGLEGTEKKMPAELSGGMRKRVGMARALIMSPEVMLYDEPTAGLDPPTAASINELIVSLRNKLGVTTVIVSHDIHSLSQVADRAAMLFQGRIIATGALSELARSEFPEVREFFCAGKEAKRE